MTDTTTPTPTPDDRDDRRRRSPLVPVALLAVGALVALGLVFSSTGSGDPPAGDAGGALVIPLETPDGGTTTLAALGGEPLVVNFFASWCPPCRVELPALEAVHQQVGDDVRFLGVNVDYDTSTWKSLVAESGITYETVYEPGQELLRAVGGKGMPTTILVTGDGEIVHVHTGLLTDDALRQLIDEELAT